jgi:hypothetical protein
VSPETSCWTCETFGLTIVSELELLGAARNPDDGATGRTTTVRSVDAGTLAAEWNGGRATTLLERRTPDGHLGMRVEGGDELGYRVDAPGLGQFVVSPDGTEIRSSVAEGPIWRWHRPLFGQALPLAATLHGLELFHASAVAIDGGVFGFVGVSGAGKTSLAIQLVAQGAQLVTDDVLSLEPREDAVWAHPGARMSNVAPEQLESLADGAEQLGRVVGSSEKVHIELTNLPEAPLPLRALYYVQRGADVDDVAFEMVHPPDPRILLSSTFLPHIVTPERLTTQLHTCARVAEETTTYRVLAPWTARAPAIAAAVRGHAAALTS